MLITLLFEIVAGTLISFICFCVYKITNINQEPSEKTKRRLERKAQKRDTEARIAANPGVRKASVKPSQKNKKILDEMSMRQEMSLEENKDVYYNQN